MLGLPPLTFLYIFLPSGDKYLADTMSILGSFSALSRLFTRLILGLSSAKRRLVNHYCPINTVAINLEKNNNYTFAFGKKVATVNTAPLN